MHILISRLEYIHRLGTLHEVKGKPGLFAANYYIGCDKKPPDVGGARPAF